MAVCRLTTKIYYINVNCISTFHVLFLHLAPGSPCPSVPQEASYILSHRLQEASPLAVHHG